MCKGQGISVGMGLAPIRFPTMWLAGRMGASPIPTEIRPVQDRALHQS